MSVRVEEKEKDGDREPRMAAYVTTKNYVITLFIFSLYCICSMCNSSFILLCTYSDITTLLCVYIYVPVCVCVL
jgi:hypothetical protein